MGLDVFNCEKRSLTLSIAGCTRLYISANGANRPDPWEGRAACMGCAIGAFHATGAPPNPMRALSEALRMICPRCGELAHGLINKTLCRSCHARDLEAKKRKNARGKPPALSAWLHTERMIMVAGPIVKTVTAKKILGLPELLIHQVKAAETPLAFGRPALYWRGVRQLEMPL